MSDPTTETTATPKPGWLTSEHALSVIALLLTAGYTTGAIPTDGLWAKLAAVLAVVLISLGYTVSRTMVKLAGLALALAFALGTSQMACGASARETTIHTAYVATDSARAAFLAFDAKHQQAIVEAAKTRDEAAAKLAAYREKRAKAVEALDASFRAIAAAAILNDNPHTLPNLAAAASLLVDAMRDMGVAP